MKNILTIANREYKYYFATPIAYLGGFFVLVVLGIFFFLNLQIAALEPQFIPGVETILVPFVTMLILITPALTARLLAEERRLGTIELLLTAPIKDWELVVGKWLGGFFLLLTLILITFIFPLILNQFVNPGIDQGPVISGYLGVILLGAALVAVGVAISSFFSNQIAAFVTTLGFYIFLWWVINPIAQSIQPTSQLFEIIRYLDFSSHFLETMVRGVLDLRDIVYYLSLTAIGLFVATLSIETGRWR